MCMYCLAVLVCAVVVGLSLSYLVIQLFIHPPARPLLHSRSWVTVGSFHSRLASLRLC